MVIVASNAVIHALILHANLVVNRKLTHAEVEALRIMFRLHGGKMTMLNFMERMSCAVLIPMALFVGGNKGLIKIWVRNLLTLVVWMVVWFPPCMKWLRKQTGHFDCGRFGTFAMDMRRRVVLGFFHRSSATGVGNPPELATFKR